MNGIIVCSHGGLAQGLLCAAEMILGPLESVVALGLEPTDRPEDFSEKLALAAKRLGCERTLVLADLFGASPFTAAVSAPAGGITVVSGCNLPMLLSAVLERGSGANFNSYLEKVQQSAREGIERAESLFGKA